MILNSRKDRILSIIANHFGVDVRKVTLASSFPEDLGADSLDIVELVIELEHEFKIKIWKDDMAGMQTVWEIFEYIENTIRDKRRRSRSRRSHSKRMYK